MEMVGAAQTQLPASVDHMNQVSSNCSTPYMSAASSPHLARPVLNFFYSAPTSPRSPKSSSFVHNPSLFDDIYDDYPGEHVSLRNPFDWELKPGVPKNCKNGEDDQEKQEENQEEKEDFEFDFSGQLDMMVGPSLSSADELFDGGKIRTLKLKPPPTLQINHESKFNNSDNLSPKSPKSAMSKFKEALSPRHRKMGSDIGSDHDPFEAAFWNTRKFHSQDEWEWKWDSATNNNNNTVVNDDDNESENRGRGRGRVKPFMPSNSNVNMNKRGVKGISRSLSPLRVSEFALLDHQEQQNLNEPNNSTGLFGWSSSISNSRKWRLKDLFLFRSASEGHHKDSQSFSKRWSFRSSTMVSGSGSGSVSGSDSGSVSKRTGQAGASAHEIHYASKRAVNEELKKTSLPYKHGLLACLAFSPVLPQFSYTFPNTSPS